nr:hypothetical protein KitaXyl93_75610 [Kitasatospora sp. Xyl93]
MRPTCPDQVAARPEAVRTANAALCPCQPCRGSIGGGRPARSWSCGRRPGRLPDQPEGAARLDPAADVEVQRGGDGARGRIAAGEPRLRHPWAGPDPPGGGRAGVGRRPSACALRCGGALVCAPDDPWWEDRVLHAKLYPAKGRTCDLLV